MKIRKISKHSMEKLNNNLKNILSENILRTDNPENNFHSFFKTLRYEIDYFLPWKPIIISDNSLIKWYTYEIKKM